MTGGVNFLCKIGRRYSVSNGHAAVKPGQFAFYRGSCIGLERDTSGMAAN